MAPRKKVAITSKSTRVSTKAVEKSGKPVRTVKVTPRSEKKATKGGSGRGGPEYDAPDVVVTPDYPRGPPETLGSGVVMVRVGKKTGRQRRTVDRSEDKEGKMATKKTTRQTKRAKQANRCQEASGTDDADSSEDDGADQDSTGAVEFESSAARDTSGTTAVEFEQQLIDRRCDESSPTVELRQRSRPTALTADGRWFDGADSCTSQRGRGESSTSRASRYPYRDNDCRYHEAEQQQHSRRHETSTVDGYRCTRDRQQMRSPVPRTTGGTERHVEWSAVDARQSSRSPSVELRTEDSHRRPKSSDDIAGPHRRKASKERREAIWRQRQPSPSVPVIGTNRAASPGRLVPPSKHLDAMKGHGTSRRRSSSWDNSERSSYRRQRDPVKPIDGSIVIPKFDGTGDLDLFLKRFQAIADYCNWNDRDTLFRLEQSIQDSAQYVLMDAPTARTVEEFIGTLRSRFGFVANAEQYRAELSHLRRGSMSVHALNLEVRRLVNKAFPGSWSTSTEVYARDAFLRALDNDELRTRILMSMPPTRDAVGRIRVGRARVRRRARICRQVRRRTKPSASGTCRRRIHAARRVERRYRRPGCTSTAVRRIAERRSTIRSRRQSQGDKSDGYCDTGNVVVGD